MEYQISVFRTLVRMTYTDETHMGVLRQYALKMNDALNMVDMSPTFCTPMVLYDSTGVNHIDCEKVFTE